MTTLLKLILSNQLFFRKKTVPVVLLAGIIAFVPVASILLVSHIKALADRPLEALETELILQDETNRQAPDQVKTSGVILPFNLGSFAPAQVTARLDDIQEVKNYSTALTLWQRDMQTNRVLVGLNVDDPQVGLRKIESFLLPGSRFFSDNKAQEIILELHFSKILGYELHDTFEIMDHRLQIVGIVDFKEQSNLNNSSIFVPSGTAMVMAGLSTPTINQVYISLFSSSEMERVSGLIEERLPGYSLITKDRLFKNLHGFNQIIYSSGRYLILLVSPVAVLLIWWVLAIYRREFSSQVDILRTLGWPGRAIRTWVVMDLGLLMANAALLVLALTVVLQLFMLRNLEIAPLLDQGFQL